MVILFCFVNYLSFIFYFGSRNWSFIYKCVVRKLVLWGLFFRRLGFFEWNSFGESLFFFLGCSCNVFFFRLSVGFFGLFFFC